MYLKEQWVNRMVQALKMKHPEQEEKSLRKRVEKLFDEKFTDTKCSIYNNYDEVEYNTSLSETLDWLDGTKPLVCESGVFFHQKNVLRSLNTEIIKECQLDMRDIHKAEKFKAKEAGDTITELVKDLQQKNDKKAANSGYGAEAEKSSFLYNLHSAMSVTASGRGQLSTAMQSMENFFADNVQFFGEDDFMIHVMNIVNEKRDWVFKVGDYIPHTPKKSQFVERFRTKFRNKHAIPEDTIKGVYDFLDDEMRCRVYYKCNIREFLTLPKIKKLYQAIADTPCNFIDPNKVPPEIMQYVNKLQDLMIEFVNYKHSVYKYEDRSKSLTRKVIIVSDTDSVFVNCEPLLRFVESEVIKIPKFDTDGEQDLFDLRIMNVIVCFANVGIANTLSNYLNTVNVPEDDRKYVKMKNEFHYSTIVTTFAMKSYFGLQTRQESVILNPPELDVKGVNFFKSTSSKHTTQFIYDDILMGEFLKPKDGKIKTRRILSKIQRYQDEMVERIKQGDMGYLKSSIRVKSPDGYARPMSIGQYRACYVWNQICEQKDLIDLPATVTLVKVRIRKPEDLVPLADYPGMFEKFTDLLEDPNLMKETKTAKGEIKTVFGGIKAIALPTEYDYVPDWLLSIIDTETLVQDNMKLFTQLYRPLGLVPGKSTHNGETMTYYTNIIRI